VVPKNGKEHISRQEIPLDRVHMDGLLLPYMKNMQKGRLVIVFVFIFFAVAPPAHAYIDLGTGSFIVQTSLAFIFGAGFIVKSYWHRLISLFKKTSTTSSSETGAVEHEKEKS